MASIPFLPLSPLSSVRSISGSKDVEEKSLLSSTYNLGVIPGSPLSPVSPLPPVGPSISERSNIGSVDVEE